MTLAHNTRIVTNGLVFALDAANPKSNRYLSNSLAQWPWSIGTGSETGFGRNGTDAENERIIDTTPFGQQDIIWQSPSNDIESNADGGWNTSNFAIDSTKMYRFSVWIRKKTTIGNGRYYLGLYGEDVTSTNIGVRRRSSGDLTTNHYFHSPRFDTDLSSSVSVNEWVLGVGHVWPEGSGIGSNHVDSGIWNLSGEKIYSGGTGDAYWETGTVEARHRSYQYYSTTTNEIQQWWHPRVDVMDGTEPSIQQLLKGVASNWELTNTHSIDMQGSYWDNKSFVFNGTSDYITTPSNSNWAFGGNGSIEQWVYPEKSGGNDRLWCTFNNVNSLDAYLNGTSFDVYMHGGVTNTGITLNQNSWNHIVVVYNAGNVATYHNGISQSPSGTISGINITNSNTLYIGQFAGGGSYYFGGKNDSTKIYNRALTAAEVAQNFNALRGRYGI